MAEFERSGFFGPMSRYRNHERDFAWLQPWRDSVVAQPSLFVGGTRDIATTLFGLVEDPVAAMRQVMTDLRVATLLEGCGHWIQQERPAQVTALLIDWLEGL